MTVDRSVKQFNDESLPALLEKSGKSLGTSCGLECGYAVYYYVFFYHSWC